MSGERQRTFRRFCGSAVILVAVAIAGCGSDGDPGTGESAESGDVDVFDLDIGDCLADFQDATELDTIEASPCSEPHSDEIFASGSIPDGAFPGMDIVEATAQKLCIAQFDEFVGKSYEDSVLDVGFLTPTEQSWNDGDRAVLCTVYDPAEEISGSLRGAQR